MVNYSSFIFFCFNNWFKFFVKPIITSSTPNNFSVKRQADRRNADLSWDKVDEAMGYVVYWGIKPDRLNLSAMIYDLPNYELRALNTDQEYYYQIEAFNENGVSTKSKVLHTE